MSCKGLLPIVKRGHWHPFKGLWPEEKHVVTGNERQPGGSKRHIMTGFRNRVMLTCTSNLHIVHRRQWVHTHTIVTKLPDSGHHRPSHRVMLCLSVAKLFEQVQ